MTEYAPQAIIDLFNTVHRAIPSAVLAGIVGDGAHTYGYHRGRNYCTDRSDYSIQLPEDKAGDGEAASALDISWNNEQDHYTVSQRLLNARNDSRMAACREFYGSMDGQSVVGWDYYYGYSVTSDSSHLWHVHLSILRQYATDSARLQNIAQVIIGGSTPPPGGGNGELAAADADRVIQNDNHNTGMIVYGDGRDVPNSQNTHPDNIKRTRADVADVKKTADLIYFGDSRESTDNGSNTHPYNIYQLYKMMLDIQTRLGNIEQQLEDIVQQTEPE